MNDPWSVGNGESEQRAVALARPPNLLTNGQHRLPTGGRHRSKRSSSAERPRNRQHDHEQGDSGFSLPLRLFSLVTGDQLPDNPSRNRNLEEQVVRLCEAHSLREREFQTIHETHLVKEKELEAKLAKKEAELEELKKVLCMYDDVSEADIHKLVDSINTRTQDLAQRTAVRWFKGLSRASSRAEASAEVGNAEVVKIEGLLGIQLSNALRQAMAPGQIHRFAPMFLQFAWQASIIATVAKILSSFSAGLTSSVYGPPSDEVFRKVAEGVMSGELQPAYGRWRFITHQYLRQLLSEEEKQAVQAYVDEALAHCRIAGQLAMKDFCPNDQAFTDAFRPQLQVVMEEAFKLLTAIQEKMITANYEPYVPSSGDEFNREFMAIDQQDKLFPNDWVVCTTGLGLWYWRKEGREGTSKMSPRSVFKEAQVLTERNLDDLVASG